MVRLTPEVRTEIKRQVDLVNLEVIEIRRDIHRHPERSKREERTSELVARYLTDLGYEVVRGANIYSVTAVINGQAKGNTIALRADMDALKLQEQAGLAFASEVDGVMHACGHDAHTAILLGAAKVLSNMSHIIPGNVKFLFQPSEEAFPGGALPMIEEGALENPRVDAAFALHVDPTFPTGHISVRTGPCTGGVTAVNIKVEGAGGHFSKPHETIDPLVVAAHVIVGLQSMVTRRVDCQEQFVLTFGQVLGGTRDNIIPKEVVIRGNMGSISNKLREGIESDIETLVKGVTESFRASGDVTFWRGYPTLYNHPEMVDIVQQVATQVIGRSNVLPGKILLAGEDFAFFAQKVPAAMWRLGVWNKSKHKQPTNLHSPNFDMDEAAIPLGVELTTSLTLEYLLRNNEGN